MCMMLYVQLACCVVDKWMTYIYLRVSIKASKLFDVTKHTALFYHNIETALALRAAMCQGKALKINVNLVRDFWNLYYSSESVSTYHVFFPDPTN